MNAEFNYLPIKSISGSSITRTKHSHFLDNKSGCASNSQLGFAIEGTPEGAVGAAIFLALMSLLLTAAVGAAQGWLLRQYLPLAQWFSATVAGGATGAAIALGVGLLGGDRLDIASVAVWAGTAMTQWFLLRRFSSRSIVWLIVGAAQIPIALNHPNSMIFKPPMVILMYGIVTAILMV